MGIYSLYIELPPFIGGHVKPVDVGPSFIKNTGRILMVLVRLEANHNRFGKRLGRLGNACFVSD